MDTHWIPRIATPFGAGMGHRGEVCGAVTGSLMALGLVQGRDVGDDPAVKERAREMSADLMARFETRAGGLRCIDLIELDLTQPHGSEIYAARGLQAQCTEYVVAAIEILEELGVLPAPPDDTDQETS